MKTSYLHKTAVVLIAMLLGGVIGAAEAKIEKPTRTTPYDWQCQDASGAPISNHQRPEIAIIECINNPTGAKVQGGTYRINRTAPVPGPQPEPEPCPEKPADETRSEDCPVGTTGVWSQSRTHTSAPAPTCWVAEGWAPSVPPAGACETPPTPALAAPVISAVRAPNAANPDRSNITISWASVTRATAYAIERCSGRTCEDYALLATVNAPAASYLNNNLPGGLALKYRVRAVSGEEFSAYSNILEERTPVTLPASGTARLSWIAPTRNEDNSPLTDLAGFRVLYGPSAATLIQTAQIESAGATSYVVSNLTPGTWFFALKAYTTHGAESALSNIASKTIP